MPIRPENKPRYPKDWPEISRRIRFERAGNCCEWCGAPNGKLIFRPFYDERWKRFPDEIGMEGIPLDVKVIKVVLTVAHLNHQPEDCRDENLAALCQRCHLRHDKHLHIENAKITRERKRAIAEPPLFPLAASE